jgi:uncharacterized protein (TIGR00661 family)
MKILYAIQGTGNGHLSRAVDIIPLLRHYGEVDILVSGKNSDVSIPFEITYRLTGLSFVFGKHGDIDFVKTLQGVDFKKLLKEIRFLPVSNYDLIVNDFEPVSAWAARLRNKPCFALSHQSAVANKFSPKPEIKDRFGHFVLVNYAPAKHKYGFHFDAYDQHIFTPVIRQQVRDLKIANEGHYTVYLPAYSDETLIRKLTQFEDVRWEVFSKHCHQHYQSGNISITPISNDSFLKSLASSAGVLCGAGFETPAEALFLGKKLMVIPMKSQYEQLCNAASLKAMGVPVLKNLKQKRLHKIAAWIESEEHIKVDYPDNSASVIGLLMEHYLSENPQFIMYPNCNPTLMVL